LAKPLPAFTDFPLLPSLLTTLGEQSLVKPTEIQERIIPLMLEQESVVGISETGSGKTLAYALPLLHLLKDLENRFDTVSEEATPRAIVMVPTRELGEQIAKVFKVFTHDTRLRVRAALGGMPMEQARRNVAGNFEVLLATPGRLVQLMKGGFIHLTDVRLLIFDEADQMMDAGFSPDSNFIAEACPPDLQLALFTATVSKPVQELMDTLFSTANIVRSAASGKLVKTLITKNLMVADGKRMPLLEKVLADKVVGGTLLFTNTREQCDDLAKQLTDKGFTCGVYRGDMDKKERRQTFLKFRDGKINLLVSTDLASRGIDIYIHRVGRTARAGRSGVVYNLVTERDHELMAKVEKL
jgi:ATP-dependent RNA helicase RhlE